MSKTCGRPVETQHGYKSSMRSEKGVVWSPGMQLLTPRHHLPIPAATNWALIIRPAFSSNPTCHLAIWSKELTNREMFRPKYQCRWSRAAQYSRSIALLPRWVGGMGACPSPLSWACRTSLHWQEHAREPFEQAWAWRKQRVGCGGGAGG